MSSSTHVQRVRILYKTILKLHRGLPVELQVLGDNYTKDEFKRHKSCAPAEAAVFMNEWTNYAILIAQQLGLRGPKTSTDRLGKPLKADELDLFNDEQVHQLYELMQSAKGDEKGDVR